jgi:hypothetical protein
MPRAVTVSRRPAALSLGTDIGARLADLATLRTAVAQTERHSGYPELGWRPDSLAAGHAGLALVFAVLDRTDPGTGWDRVGHDHLQRAVAAAEAGQHGHSPNPGLFSGLSGLGLAAHLLAASRDRYGRLLAAVDAAVVPQATAMAARVAPAAGCRAADIDVISGLSGIGAYLLCRRGSDSARAGLASVLTALAGLLADAGDPRRWHSPADLSSESLREAYPGGHYDCGLAHGVPGPLALLAIATLVGAASDLDDVVDVHLVRAGIDAAAHWLADRRMTDDWGPTWPNTVPLAGAGEIDAPNAGAPRADGRVGGSRATWCYGSPGVARALWLAGRASENTDLADLALCAMRCALARPARARGITSPTLCHGTAGLLQITHRFADETGLPDLVQARDALLGELLAAYDPRAVLGYRNVEPSGTLVDAPGLLDGAAGVVLALLSAAGVSTSWDRVLLLV